MAYNRRGTSGKLYKIKSRSTCEEEEIAYSPLPKGVAGHMVVALGRPDVNNMVKVATITSKTSGNAPYYPIAPTAKRPYPLQLHLRFYNNQYCGRPSALPLNSCVRAEEHLVPFERLFEVEGDFGEHLMLKEKSVSQLLSALQAR